MCTLNSIAKVFAICNLQPRQHTHTHWRSLMFCEIEIVKISKWENIQDVIGFEVVKRWASSIGVNSSQTKIQLAIVKQCDKPIELCLTNVTTARQRREKKNHVGICWISPYWAYGWSTCFICQSEIPFEYVFKSEMFNGLIIYCGSKSHSGT